MATGGSPRYDSRLSSLRRPTGDGHIELLLTPIELLDQLAQLVTPPQIESGFDQSPATDDWPGMDQTARQATRRLSAWPQPPAPPSRR